MSASSPTPPSTPGSAGSAPELSSEDAKLVTLARATRARIQAAQGAAVRDELGRTYAAASVALPSLSLTAAQVCVAMAVASGSTRIAAAVLLGEDAALSAADGAVLADLGGPDVVVHLADARGTVLASTTAGAADPA